MGTAIFNLVKYRPRWGFASHLTPILGCLMWEENIYFDACDSLVFVLELFELVSGICGVVRRAKAHVAPTGSEYIGSERVITMSGRACQDGRSRARWLRAPVQLCLAVGAARCQRGRLRI